MRILLVKPQAPHTLEIAPPLGLCYLATRVRNAGQEVKILDLQLTPDIDRTYLNELRTWQPDIIGFSAVACEYSATKRLAELARMSCTDVKLVVGGPLSTGDPEKARIDGLVDLVVVGEGEDRFAEAIDQWQREDSPPQIMQPTDGEVSASVAEDGSLDHIGFPAWDLLDLEAYFRRPRQGLVARHRRYFPIITSRGCPYRCIYCLRPLGERFRYRSSDNIINEIDMLQRKYGIQEIQINDDVFNFDVNRAKRLLVELGRRDQKVALAFIDGLRGDKVDREMAELMRRAGTYRVCIAIDSGSERVQKLIRKRLDLARTKQGIFWMQKNNIMVNIFLMVGFPGESWSEARTTGRYAISTAAHTATFFVAVPFSGTQLAAMTEQEGRVPEDRQFFSNDTKGATVLLRRSNKIKSIIFWSLFRFYLLSPRRLYRLYRLVPNRAHLPKLAYYSFLKAVGRFPPPTGVNERRRSPAARQRSNLSAVGLLRRNP